LLALLHLNFPSALLALLHLNFPSALVAILILIFRCGALEIAKSMGFVDVVCS
jgi:hypothetical protein